MFRPTITTTPLVTQTANTYFANIRGENFNHDVTFISTLRALVSPRISDGESVSLYFRGTSFDKETVERNPDGAVLDAMYNSRQYEDGSIVIHNLSGNAQGNLACLKLIEKSFTTNNSRYERIVKVTEFFKKTFYALCYVNPTNKKVVIFVDNLNIRRMHYLQCSIFAFLPWYFNPEAGVTEDEMELIQSLRETTPERYMNAISKIASGYDFRGMFIRQQLKGFETAYEEQQVRIAQENISDYVDQIRRYNNSISAALNRKRDAEIRLLGLKTKIAQMEGEDSEIMEYFLCNQKLDLECVRGSEMTFVVKDYLMYFDEDMAKTVIDNRRSYIYRYIGDSMEEDDVEKLMYAIFIDQVLKLRFCCAYSIRLGERVEGLRNYNYNESYETYIPNPHIDRYSCLGNYERTMNERLADNDAIGAIEQCISSCKSLNFADSTVMEVFMERMCGRNGYRHNKCIELPDGSIVDMRGAIKWMKEQEAAEQAKESEQTESTETTANADTVTDEETGAEAVDTEETETEDDFLEEDDLF